MISNSLEEFVSMVFIKGSKKFMNNERRIEKLTSPININALFFKIFRGFLDTISPNKSKIEGIIITGPISIIFSIILFINVICMV